MTGTVSSGGTVRKATSLLEKLLRVPGLKLIISTRYAGLIFKKYPAKELWQSDRVFFKNYQKSVGVAADK